MTPMTPTTPLLAQATAEATVSTGEAIAFWILGPLALAGALGMVFARNAVHSALWLVLTMLTLGLLYLAQQAQFLGFTQIIVYTGAIMMLFLFVLMLAGRDSSDSVVEVLRGQRLAGALLGVGVAGLFATAMARGLADVTPAAPLDPWSPEGGGAGGLGRVIFGDYLFPFELTAALLITAAMGGMVLSFTTRHGKGGRKTQRELVEARFRGEYERPSPKPGPGVFATANSVATPALLPDGSVAPESLSELIENTSAARLEEQRRQVAGDVPKPDAHALVAPDESEEGKGK
ncbi:NADH dehydrogenase subunit J [Prauserella shujinwangii]|uniref:NADH-quinone oxidoreductase subunit J n=1 Tax=Prauserella shujinwangii TaxID=1453103 RepID=A0A2T0LQI4_9PSEU|nr:NADH-quinone oxidoreductase subunit J [Prauserella shujinwangii]PRX45595.1 NADH dehydrogenase subunit J [Prauserella shujinwangii]